MIICILIILGSVVLDQVTKQLVVANLAVGESVDVIEGVFRFTYVQNRGAAFGMLSEHRWIFMIVSTVAIAAVLVYLWKNRKKGRFVNIALSLIAGGGIGNMIDRVYLNYVIDFLDFCAFPNLWVWVFNVADACVCIGAGLLFVWCIVGIVREAIAAKNKTEEPSVPDASAEKTVCEPEKKEEEEQKEQKDS